MTVPNPVNIQTVKETVNPWQDVRVRVAAAARNAPSEALLRL